MFTPYAAALSMNRHLISEMKILMVLPWILQAPTPMTMATQAAMETQTEAAQTLPAKHVESIRRMCMLQETAKILANTPDLLAFASTMYSNK